MVKIKLKCLLISEALKDKTIVSLDDLFNIIRFVMEYVDKYSEISGEEKKKLVKDNILQFLLRRHKMEIIDIYLLLVDPYILIISKSGLLLNFKNKFLKRCCL